MADQFSQIKDGGPEGFVPDMSKIKPIPIGPTAQETLAQTTLNAPKQSALNGTNLAVGAATVLTAGATLGAVYFALLSLSKYDDDLTFTQKMDEYYLKELQPNSTKYPAYEPGAFKSNWQKAKEAYGLTISGLFSGLDTLLGTNSMSTIGPLMAHFARQDGEDVQHSTAQLMGDKALEGLQVSRDLRATYGNRGGYNPNNKSDVGSKPQSPANSSNIQVQPDPSVPGKTGAGALTQATGVKHNGPQITTTDPSSMIQKNNTNRPQQTSHQPYASNRKNKTVQEVTSTGGQTADDLMKL